MRKAGLAALAVIIALVAFYCLQTGQVTTFYPPPLVSQPPTAPVVATPCHATVCISDTMNLQGWVSSTTFTDPLNLALGNTLYEVAHRLVQSVMPDGMLMLMLAFAELDLAGGRQFFQSPLRESGSTRLPASVRTCRQPR